MKKFYEISGHQQWIGLKGKNVISSSCTCQDFQFRHLKKEEEKIIQIGECKHIQRLKARNKWE